MQFFVKQPIRVNTPVTITCETFIFRANSPMANNPGTSGCGTIPATFSHTRIDHAHERPPHTQTCAQKA
ncbi:hypothetical protein DBR18_27000 [Pseudomonas sp. HMWF021]|nr:hypothetical protein DBR18_27000 [Pseudomonas sp. HMWF021]